MEIDNENFPLPQVATSLIPYIRTRQEALRIRRTLTVYLTSQLKGVDSLKGSSLALVAPAESVHLSRIPAELSGLRKAYLKELRLNITASKDFQALATQSHARADPESSSGPISTANRTLDNSGDSVLHTYLPLLRQRQRYEKLGILQDYLDVLAGKCAAKADYLDIRRIQKDAPPLPQVQTETGGRSDRDLSGSSSNTVDELVIRLEKAVLRARHNLEKEKKLLADLQLRQQSTKDSTHSGTLPGGGSRYQALSQTWDELNKWIDGELSNTDCLPNNFQDKPTGSEIRHSTKDTQQHMVEIKHEYTKYLQARRMSLAAVVEATSPMPPSLSVDHRLHSQKDGSQTETVNGALLPALPYLNAHVLSPLNLQKSITQQRSYITNSLAKEQQATVHVLDRFTDESHLLPAYPFLVTDSRFQHIAAALGSKKPLQVDEQSTSRHQMKTLEMARAWAFAAGAARASTQEVLEDKLADGTEHTRNCHEVLENVRILLGKGLRHAGTEEDPASEDEDIWVTGAARDPRGRKEKTKLEGTDSSTSIWYRLRGDVRSENSSP